MALSKQEEGLKALENAKDIQNKFDKKGKDIQNRLLDVIKREDNIALVSIVFKITIAQFKISNYIFKQETQIAKEKDAFSKLRKKQDLVLPHLSGDEMRFLDPKLNKYKAENEVYFKKTQLY